MSCLQLVVGLAFCRWGKLDINDRLILDQIPDNIRASLKKFNLEGTVITYAVCPECNKTFAPSFKLSSSVPAYPNFCDGREASDSTICETSLTRATILSDGSIRTVPIKKFAYHSFADFIANLLSRADTERACEDALNDVLPVSSDKPTNCPNVMKNIFDGSFIREFKGPDNKSLFAYQDGETRLLFALFVDFFNVNMVLHRGATTTNGIIAMACLNIPIEHRYLPQNMYIAGIIPGPEEPSLTEINHFLEPLIDELVEFWEPGIIFSRTALHENRVVCCAIACVVCDLPAARKVAAFSGVTGNHFCTVCSCRGKVSLQRCDIEHAIWLPKTPDIQRKHAEDWRDGTLKTQTSLFQDNGLRYSILWKLRYWDPAQQLVVDPMHCLLENLASHHFRDYLRLVNSALNEPEAPCPAFSHNFLPFRADWTRPTEANTLNPMSTKLHEDASAIRTKLDSVALGADVAPIHRWLLAYSAASLQLVCTQFNVPLLFSTPSKNGRHQKTDYAWSLAKCVGIPPLHHQLLLTLS
jgi:hypothetical protein